MYVLIEIKIRHNQNKLTNSRIQFSLRWNCEFDKVLNIALFRFIHEFQRNNCSIQRVFTTVGAEKQLWNELLSLIFFFSHARTTKLFEVLYWLLKVQYVHCSTYYANPPTTIVCTTYIQNKYNVQNEMTFPVQKECAFLE